MCLLRAARAGWAILFAALLALGARPVPAQSAAEAEIERELESGGKQVHPVDLRAGEVVRAVADQRGIDVVLTLRDPTGAPRAEMDGVTGLVGPEELRWEADEGGPYVVEVRASALAAQPGRYALRLDVLPGADPAERAWMGAQRLFMEGRRALRAGGAALAGAIAPLAAAIPMWREAGDPKWEATTWLSLGVARFRLNQAQAAAGDYERVVASLWQVDDVATAELMRRFYRGMLRDGQRPAAALRAAQIEMWREEAWRSPYYWSGFVLQGEWR